ncbi:hypothetical protein, partial [Actinomadura sp. 7K507]|uniref:hypothetical protein n=1 Tax=Actinomadura sp. 7K507 TaxID=2530365 RepID=UPI001A9DDF20
MVIQPLAGFDAALAPWREPVSARPDTVLSGAVRPVGAGSDQPQWRGSSLLLTRTAAGLAVEACEGDGFRGLLFGGGCGAGCGVPGGGLGAVGLDSTSLWRVVSVSVSVGVGVD